MPDTLHLEFVCTDAERKQAQALHLQRQMGGGSKVLTTIVLLLVLAGMLLGFYIRVQREVSADSRPYVYVAAFGLSFVAWLWMRRRSRSAAPSVMSMDVSDEFLCIRVLDGEARMPWSAFGRLLESPELFVLVDRSGTTLLPIPRRAFPSEAWQEWFQTLATNRIGLAEIPSALAPFEKPPDVDRSVRLRNQLRFSDHLDRTLTSWLTRGILAGILVMLIGVTLYSAANPPPNAVYSATQVFFMFLLPFLLVSATVLVLVISVNNWWSYSRHAVPQEISLSPDSIAFSGPDGSGTLPWSTYDRFKETRRSFLMWNSHTSDWMMLPKRSFGFDEDVSRCRDILECHLQRSTWFFA